MNLLQETVEILEANDKKLSDIVFLKFTDQYLETPYNCKVTEKLLKKILNVEYYNTSGLIEINISLQLVGADFWLERHHKCGAEWWEFKKMPVYDDTIAYPIRKLNSHKHNFLTNNSFNDLTPGMFFC